MRYAFVTNVFSWKSVGGPQSRARNFQTMLKRHAEFEFAFVKSNFEDFFSQYTPEVVHIQSNNRLLQMAMNKNLRIIAGPNVVWNEAPKKLLSYPNMVCTLIPRPQPVPRRLKPSWPIREFPVFVDEKFFSPKDKSKQFDVLTIGKSFDYDAYDANLMKLTKLVKKMGLRHKHLKRYSLKEYRQALDKSKLLLFPSPRESGASICHALLECNMMNVPFIGLDSVVIPRDFEYDTCRGLGAGTISDMASMIQPTLQNLDQFSPRQWVVERFSTLAAYRRLKAILDELA